MQEKSLLLLSHIFAPQQESALVINMHNQSLVVKETHSDTLNCEGGCVISHKIEVKVIKVDQEI